jgi:hypothetical protein
MPTTYNRADLGEEIYQVAEAVISREGSLKDIREAEVTYDFLMARNPEGPAVKLHGYDCTAIIKINSYKDRVQGKADCTIVVDESEWDRMGREEREGLLHHEFLHLEVVRDKTKDKKTGAVTVHGPKTDDAGRPKLKMRLHDFQVGIFKETAEKYRDKSVDVQQIEPLVQWVQTTLNFG